MNRAKDLMAASRALRVRAELPRVDSRSTRKASGLAGARLPMKYGHGDLRFALKQKLKDGARGDSVRRSAEHAQDGNCRVRKDALRLARDAAVQRLTANPTVLAGAANLRHGHSRPNLHLPH